MRFPWIRRSTHELIVRLVKDNARAELTEQRSRLCLAHEAALDRYRGQMRPAAREAADRAEGLVQEAASLQSEIGALRARGGVRLRDPRSA